MRKYILFLFIGTAISCNDNKRQEPKENTKLIWSESIQTILPLERDTMWDGSDLTNVTSKFDEEKIFSSITNGVLAGKLKAYRNYPEEMLSIDDIKNILVKWDSTKSAEDPDKPGTFEKVVVKEEISADRIAQIKFHEKIELDTISYTFSKKVSYISLYAYKTTEKGYTVGIRKIFDVKLNDQ
jgi:hypothetical protein